MKVTRVMTQKLITASADEGVRSAFFKMRRNRVRHLPIVDDQMHLLGIVSDRDLRRPDWVDEAPDIAHVYDLDDHMELGDLMTTNVMTVYTYDRLQKAARIMHQHRFGALPVLNKDEKLAGMLSAIDLIGVLDEMLDDEIKKKKGKA